MAWIIAYLAAFLVALLAGTYLDLSAQLPAWMNSIADAYRCMLAGGFGGLLYLVRAVYLNRAVRKSWDKDWHIWYFLRPFASLISGAVAFLFLSAGLLILGTTPQASSSKLGFIALAFIAGLNVDRFMEKVETLAEAAWGIKKSRVSSRNDDAEK